MDRSEPPSSGWVTRSRRSDKKAADYSAAFPYCFICALMAARDLSLMTCSIDRGRMERGELDEGMQPLDGRDADREQQGADDEWQHKDRPRP